MSSATTAVENQDIATRLVDAWRCATPTTPPSVSISELDSTRATQIANTAVELLGTARVVGYKIGLVAAAAQQAMGYHEPVFGRVFVGDWFQAGATLPRRAFVNPKIEPECAMVVARRFGGLDATMDEARRAVASVVPAFEIADTRYGVAAGTVGDLIADNGGGAAAVLSLANAVPTDEIDLRGVRLVVEAGGAPLNVRSPWAGGVNDDGPYGLVAWLARQLAAQGLFLEPGQFVLTGSWVRPIDVNGPLAVRADYSGLGAVEMSMS